MPLLGPPLILYFGQSLHSTSKEHSVMITLFTAAPDFELLNVSHLTKAPEFMMRGPFPDKKKKTAENKHILH